MQKFIYVFFCAVALTACGSDTKTAEQVENARAANAATANATTNDAAASTATNTPTASPATTASRYQSGDKLTVLAGSGLIVREKPDQAAAKIATVATGKTVTIVGNPAGAFESEVCKGFAIKGNWVKVSADGKEGYAFDGFLSKLAAPANAQGDPYGKLMAKAKSVSKTATNPSEKDKKTAVFMREVEKFDNGVESLVEGYEGGSKIITKYPSKLLSLNEAYLLYRCAFSKSTGKWVYDAKDKALRLEEEMSATIISQAGDMTVVEHQTAD